MNYYSDRPDKLQRLGFVFFEFFDRYQARTFVILDMLLVQNVISKLAFFCIERHFSELAPNAALLLS